MENYVFNIIKEKHIRLLKNLYSRKKSIREISREIGMDYNNVRFVINSLEKEGFIYKEKGGNLKKDFRPDTVVVIFTQKGMKLLKVLEAIKFIGEIEQYNEKNDKIFERILEGEIYG